MVIIYRINLNRRWQNVWSCKDRNDLPLVRVNCLYLDFTGKALLALLVLTDRYDVNTFEDVNICGYLWLVLSTLPILVVGALMAHYSLLKNLQNKCLFSSNKTIHTPGTTCRAHFLRVHKPILTTSTYSHPYYYLVILF